MWDVNAAAIYYLRSDNVLRIPCQNSWQYTKYDTENYAELSCYDVLLFYNFKSA